MKIHLIRMLVILLFLSWQVSAELTRGPYIQNATATSMVIKWQTSVASDSQVFYGLAPGELNLSKSTSELTTSHEMLLDNLTPNSRYYYSIGSSTDFEAGNDDDHFFYTSPMPGQSHKTRIWVLGDSGTGTQEQIDVRDAYFNLDQTRTNGVLALGDNAYEQGTDNEYSNNFFAVYQTLFRSVPVWSTRGNHERSEDAYYEAFVHPIAGEAGGVASGTEAYYSFDFGDIHFVVLDSFSSDFSEGAAQYQWLEQDLTDTTQKWIIAYWHHPPYNITSRHDSDVEAGMKELRQFANPILERYGVDLQLSGHNHSYSRSYFINSHYGTSDSWDVTQHIVQTGDGDSESYKKSSEVGAVYVMSGSAGKVTYTIDSHPANIAREFELGSFVIDVDGDRLNGRFLRENGLVQDQFTIEKLTQNEAPVASDDNAITDEDNAVNISILANDTDMDGSLDYTGITIVSSTSNGSALVNKDDGIVTYTPNANFNGSDGFTYTVTDNEAEISNTATVSITVISVNDAPVTDNDSAVIDEDNTVVVNVVDNDTDIDGTIDPATVRIINNPVNGSASVSAGIVTYTPSPDFNGNDNLAYTVNDNEGATSNTATVSITVTSVNDAPIANNDSATTNEDTTVTFAVLVNDSDIDGSVSIADIIIVSEVSNGVMTINAADGTVSYLPNIDFNGSDGFTYMVSDNDGANSNIATVSITVNPVNDAPIANDDSVTTNEDNALIINVADNDIDSDSYIDTAKIAITGDPSNGNVTVSAGIVIYTPDANFNGNDSFTYTVSDSDDATSNVATVNITIISVNDAPIAKPVIASTEENIATVIDVLSNDNDSDGTIDIETVAIASVPSNGSATVSDDGIIIYSPNTGFSGGDSFSYTVMDNDGTMSNSATIFITVFGEVDPILYSGKVMNLPDITADGIAEVGLLRVDVVESKVRLEILNGKDRVSLDEIVWVDNFFDTTVSIHLIPDMNDNGFDEVGLFGIQDIQNNKGKPQIFVRDLKTGNKVGEVYNWVANWRKVSALILEDMTGDGIAEIAIQGRFRDGNRPQLIVKIGNTNTILDTYSYPDLFVSPQYYQHSDINGDGKAEISTFGRLIRNNKVQVNIASGLDSGTNMKAYNFPDNWDDVRWHRLDDSNGDGQDDWGMFGTLRADGRPQLVNKDGVSPLGALRIFAWPAEMQDAQFFRIPDMNNDDVDEVAAAGRRSNNDRYQFQVQDGTDRNVLLANHNLNLNLESVTYHVLPDLSGDEQAEIGFLGINPQGEYELVIRHGDAANGEYATYNLSSDWQNAPTITSLGDTDDDGLQDLLIYGQNASGEALVITDM